jgi:hypothetical protein
VEGYCERGNEPCGSLKRWGKSFVAVQPATSQEGLCSVELVKRREGMAFIYVVTPKIHSKDKFIWKRYLIRGIDSVIHVLSVTSVV